MDRKDELLEAVVEKFRNDDELKKYIKWVKRQSSDRYLLRELLQARADIIKKTIAMQASAALRQW